MIDAAMTPTHEVHLPSPIEDKWQREYRMFLRLLPDLLNTHRDKYVALHEEKVVDSDDDLVRLALRVYERHGLVPIYMDRVTEHGHSEVHLPHYRIVEKLRG